MTPSFNFDKDINTMSIVSFVDQLNNSGNFDEVINAVITSSFLLNVGHEGVEITSVAGPVNTTLTDFNILVTAVNVWKVLVNVAFDMPLINPDDYSESYIKTASTLTGDFSISGNSFSMSADISTGDMTYTPIQSTFLTWGEFNIFQFIRRNFIIEYLNINQIPS